MLQQPVPEDFAVLLQSIAAFIKRSRLETDYLRETFPEETDPDYLAFIRSLYGVEEVPVLHGISGIKQFNKNVLIDAAVERATSNGAPLHTHDTAMLIRTLKVAALQAEYAELAYQAELPHRTEADIPDPRYRTCFAAARGLAQLVRASVNNNQPVANYATTTLLQLGGTNYQWNALRQATDGAQDCQILSLDSNIIAYGYLREMLFLLRDTETRETVMSNMFAMSVSIINARDYIAAVACCAQSFFAQQKAPVQLQAFDPFMKGIDIESLILVLTDGLKLEHPRSEGAKLIEQTLCGFSRHPSIDPDFFEPIFKTVAWHITTEKKLPHHQFLGKHFRELGARTLRAMRRARGHATPAGGHPMATNG